MHNLLTSSTWTWTKGVFQWGWKEARGHRYLAVSWEVCLNHKKQHYLPLDAFKCIMICCNGTHLSFSNCLGRRCLLKTVARGTFCLATPQQANFRWKIGQSRVILSTSWAIFSIFLDSQILSDLYHYNHNTKTLKMWDLIKIWWSQFFAMSLDVQRFQK